MIKIILYTSLILALAALFTLLYWNRTLPRIQEYIITIIALITIAIITVLKPETIKETFSTIYLTKTDTNMILWESPYNPNRKGPLYLADAAEAIEAYIERKTKEGESEGNIRKEIFNDTYSFIYLTEFLVIEELFKFFHWGWIPKRQVKSIPLVGITYWQFLSTNKDTVYKKRNLPKSLKNNLFFTNISEEFSLHLPPGTKINHIPIPEKGFPFSIITFKNKYCTLKIQVGDVVSPYFRLSKPLKEYFCIPDSDESKYKMLIINTYIEAKFSRWRIGSPNMENYRKWIKAIITILKEHLSTDAWPLSH